MKGLVLKINDRFRNRKVEFFNDFSFNLVYNAIASVFSFSYNYNPDSFELKELSCVTHFHEVTLFYNEELLLTGVVTHQDFNSDPVKNLVKISGYAKTGVLSDCQIPPRIYPLQSNGLSLVQICNKLVNPFQRNYNLRLSVDPSVSSDANKVIKTTTAGPTQTIASYISSIAAQKNIIVSHNEEGNLLLTQSKTSSLSVLDIDTTKADMSALSVRMTYNGQMMHSHITVMKQTSSDGGNAGEYTIRNPYVIGSVYRPKVITQSSGDDNDTKLVARRELANELKGVSVVVNIHKWIVGDKIIKPNSIITIVSPENYIFQKEKFLIESISYTGNSESTTAILKCVLPEVYNNEKVRSIFEGINLHAPHD